LAGVEGLFLLDFVFTEASSTKSKIWACGRTLGLGSNLRLN